MNDEEFGSFQIFEIEIQKGRPNNSAALQNWFPPPAPNKLGPPFLIRGNFKKSRKVLLNHAKHIEI